MTGKEAEKLGMKKLLFVIFPCGCTIYNLAEYGETSWFSHGDPCASFYVGRCCPLRREAIKNEQKDVYLRHITRGYKKRTVYIIPLSPRDQIEQEVDN